MIKDENYYKNLAKSLMFNLSDKEASDMKHEFEILYKQLELLDKIDTTDVKEMIYPFEDETHFLREDVVDHTISQEDALKNAPVVKEGHIVVCKVVK